MAKTTRNRFAGPCDRCGETVEAGTGLAVGHNVGGRFVGGRWTVDYRWTVRHAPKVWHGSPVSGRFVGGCPGPDTE